MKQRLNNLHKNGPTPNQMKWCFKKKNTSNRKLTVSNNVYSVGDVVKLNMQSKSSHDELSYAKLPSHFSYQFSSSNLIEILLQFSIVVTLLIRIVTEYSVFMQFRLLPTDQ